MCKPGDFIGVILPKHEFISEKMVVFRIEKEFDFEKAQVEFKSQKPRRANYPKRYYAEKFIKSLIDNGDLVKVSAPVWELDILLDEAIPMAESDTLTNPNPAQQEKDNLKPRLPYSPVCTD